ELLRDPQVLALRYQAAEPYARRSGSHRDAKVFDAHAGISEWYVPGKDWWITRPRPITKPRRSYESREVPDDQMRTGVLVKTQKAPSKNVGRSQRDPRPSRYRKAAVLASA